MDICFEHVAKTFGNKLVFQDFNLTIPSEGCTCVVGPSGCGKTTLVRLLAGLEIPDKGKISGVEGKRISMVFQEDRLLPWYSALKNVLLGMGRKKGYTAFAEEILTGLQLQGDFHTNVMALSGGMKRRVAIARALAAEYDILILDEACKGLDIDTKKVVIDTVAHYSKGKCVITITHDPAEWQGRVTRTVNLDGRNRPGG